MSHKKRFNSTVNRICLNETVSNSDASSETTFFKPSILSGTSKSQIIELKCDLTYNDYLQSLMKYQITHESIKKQEDILRGQILLQQEHFNKREDDLKQIKSDTEQLNMKEYIVKMIKSFEKNINNIQQMYHSYQTQKKLEHIRVELVERTKELTFESVQSINTQDEYDKLIESLKKLTNACAKIVHCSREFEGVHNLAEDCRHLNQIIGNIKETRTSLSIMETHTITTLIQKLSDTFAKKYENIY